MDLENSWNNEPLYIVQNVGIYNAIILI